MKKLILFDIDKTLIQGKEFQINPWKEAFFDVFGIENHGLQGIDTDGKTHLALFYEVIKKHGIARESALEKKDIFFTALTQYFEKALINGKILKFSYMHDTLLFLQKQGFCFGLITGNIRDIAFLKLQGAGIDRFFHTGGFGDLSEKREELVSFAIKQSYFDCDFSLKNIFVIGDTPLDISSANIHGVNTIGVATGKYSGQDLEDADFVLDNLQDTTKLLKILNYY